MVAAPKVLIADKEIDRIDLFCPMPVFSTRAALREMNTGGLPAMRSDDPASDADMPGWCRDARQVLLGSSREGGISRFLVRKTR
jgi:TusA-related sulfurtransferase